MRIRSALFALALAPSALAFAVTPADIDETVDTCSTYSDAGTPEDVSDDVITCTEQQYLSCQDTVDPAGKVHDFYNVPVVTLTPDAPDTSFTAGGGCGYPQQNLLTNVNQGTFSTFDFGGFVTTNVDSVTVEIHDLQPLENAVQAANGEVVDLGVRLTINQQSPFGIEKRTGATGTEFTVPAELDLPITATISETGLSTSYVFTITNIGADLPDLLRAFDADGDGIRDDVFNKVLVTIGMPGLDYPFGTLPSDNLAPVWGAIEVPASITVNGEVRGDVFDATQLG